MAGGFDDGFDAGFELEVALTLAEGLVNAIKTYLDANMAAKLTALDAEYADGISL